MADKIKGVLSTESDDEDEKEGILSADATPTHHVVDTQTGTIVGTYSSRKRAATAADKRDLEYGAVRYRVVPIPIKVGPA